MNEYEIRKWQFALGIYTPVAVALLIIFGIVGITSFLLPGRKMLDDAFYALMTVAVSSVWIIALSIAGLAVGNAARKKFYSIVVLIFMTTAACLHFYLANVYRWNLPEKTAISFSLVSELAYFVAFTINIFWLFNLLLILRTGTLTKSFTIAIDYIYFSAAFIAILLKYISSSMTNHRDIDVFAFILAAVAVALRVTRTNAEYIMNKIAENS